MKKEIPGNSVLSTNLMHEYALHRLVSKAFDQYDDTIKSNVRVPRLLGIVQGTDDAYWTTVLHKFPAEYRTPGNMALMERILPLPKIIRKALIAHFYPRDTSPIDSAIIETVLNDTPNKHCLARTYLGKENGVFTKEKFSLRNFPLYLFPMQQLGLDIGGIASSMGQAFAIMHWGAGVNGDDVEFVLGSSTIKGKNTAGETLDFQHRSIGLFLLDFGQCDLVDFSDAEDVIYQSLKGAMVTGDNQLFIPHYKKTPELFSAFKEGYMNAGNIILEEKNMEMKFSMERFMAEYEEYAEDFL
jgi:hypothetical protein